MYIISGTTQPFFVPREIQDLQNVESILRSILSYTSQPAVIMTASFSLMDKIQMGNDAHLPVAQYYDVPVGRPSRLCPRLFTNASPLQVIKYASNCLPKDQE